MTQYDLVPEVIYNALEKKMGEKINSMISSTYYRQIELANDTKQLSVKQHELDARIRDLQILLKKDTNIKEQFASINFRMDNMEINNKKINTDLDKLQTHLENKFDKTTAKIRLIASDLKAQSSFLT